MNHLNYLVDLYKQYRNKNKQISKSISETCDYKAIRMFHVEYSANSMAKTLILDIVYNYVNEHNIDVKLADLMVPNNPVPPLDEEEEACKNTDAQHPSIEFDDLYIGMKVVLHQSKNVVHKILAIHGSDYTISVKDCGTGSFTHERIHWLNIYSVLKDDKWIQVND